MKKFIFFLLFLGIEGNGIAQDSLPKYWISFTDKKNTPYSLGKPEEFLSESAIERRARQGIEITEEDLPVDPEYLDQITSKGIRIINVSKWFNGALVEISDSCYLDTLRKFDFIQNEILQVKPALVDEQRKDKYSEFKTSILPVDEFYGYSYNQIAMLQGDFLHNQGYRGEGILIAILDAGFTNANAISSLAHVWDNNRVIATKDFVKDSLTLFNSHNHGTIIFSILAGVESGILIGSAPDAIYALIRTEDGNTEYLIEEYNWICGAEFADSIGADVINSSLGYTIFNDSSQNHTYSDMDGHTAPASIAAMKAAAKGIIVSCAAGNDGNKEWFRIGSPADADSILAVGATDSLGIITKFSSRGYSFDGRVKPDVVAQGNFTLGQYSDGGFVYVSGTSASSPIVAGMAACLWQARPQRNNMEIVEAIRKSASQYFTPDSAYGYGIPDMIKADWMLRSPEEIGTNPMISFTIFPNPANEYFYLQIYRPEQTDNEWVTLSFYDLFGNLIRQERHQITGEQFVLGFSDISSLSTGLYILEITCSGRNHTMLFSKRS
jgi:subtilisin family serine protease